jgi:hypothetical protein
MVKDVWERPVSGQSPIVRWNNKMRALRKYLSGWARHTTDILKKEKLRLSSIIDDLEALAKVRPLSVQEIELKKPVKCTNSRSPSRGGAQMVPTIKGSVPTGRGF